MSTISYCASHFIPTTPGGKIIGAFVLAGGITLLVLGILASQPASTLGIPQSGFQAMMGVGGTLLSLYVLTILCCRCTDPDGYCSQ